MKKIFAFAMVLVSMAAVMTSCNNDNDMVKELDPANKPAAEKQKAEDSRTIYFMAAENQTNYLNCDYSVQVGSETLTVNIENMTPTTDYDLLLKEKVAFATESGMKPVVYLYNVPANMSGAVTIYPAFSVKEGAELGEEVDVLAAAFSKGMGNGNMFMSKGISSDKLVDYLACRNNVKVMSGNIK